MKQTPSDRRKRNIFLETPLRSSSNYSEQSPHTTTVLEPSPSPSIHPSEQPTDDLAALTLDQLWKLVEVGTALHKAGMSDSRTDANLARYLTRVKEVMSKPQLAAPHSGTTPLSSSDTTGVSLSSKTIEGIFRRADKHLPEWSGKPDDLRAFFRNFEAALVSVKISSESWPEALLLSVAQQAEAYAWVDRHTADLPWEDVKRLFRCQFGPPIHKRGVAEVLLLTIQQESKETLMAYSFRFENLLEQSKFGKLTKKSRFTSFLITILIKGLRGSSGKDKVARRHKRKPFRSIAKVLTCLQDKLSRPSAPGSQVAPTSPNTSTTTRRSHKRQQLFCATHGMCGHTTADCRSKAPAPSSTTSPSSKKSKWSRSPAPAAKAVKRVSQCPPAQYGTVLTINGSKPVEAIFDCGSSVTLIPRSLALRWNLRIHPSTTPLVSVDNTPLKVVGYVKNCVFAKGNFAYTLPKAYVMDDLTELLIGADLAPHLGIIVHGLRIHPSPCFDDTESYNLKDTATVSPLP